MVSFNVELLSELAINGLDNLTGRVDEPFRCARQRVLLVTSRQGEQPDPILLPKFRGFLGINVSFITNHGQVSMVCE